MDDQIRDILLSTTEEMLEAQLKAVRSLIDKRKPGKTSTKKGMSQIDMTYAILHDAGQPLHVTRIIERISDRYGITPDRESLVSSLSKRIARADRFIRVGPNLFALRKEE